MSIYSAIYSSSSMHSATMKIFVATLLLACVAVQARTYNSSPVIPLKDYYAKSNDQSRIISGSPANQGDFPWQAAVNMRMSNGNAFCGGSLIGSRWVLTAAHCVQGVLSWEIKVGGIRIDVSNEPGTVVVSTSEGRYHENYNNYLNNDIALIKLPKDVPESDSIKYSRLPARSEVGDSLENIKLTVSGWGKTSNNGGVSNRLNYVQLDTISNQKCAQIYGSQVIISSTLCCVGHPEHSTCNGDSGGPLVRFDANGRATQVGVVSFVHSAGCSSGNPSGYVRTAKFLDWINKHTGIPIRD